MAAANPALVEFNKNTRQFWADQKILMDERMADRAILETAVEAIKSETKRQVALRNQNSFEGALKEAEGTKKRFLGQQARLGGISRKANALRLLIEDIVRKDVGITRVELLKELFRLQGDGVVDDIDSTRIYFRGPLNSSVRGGDEAFERKVTTDSVPISGLKHLLTRVRKKIQKESRSR